MRTLLADPTNLSVRLALNFMKCIVDYEHYIPLCIPLETSVDSHQTLKFKFWYFWRYTGSYQIRKNHYIAGHLLNLIQLSATVMTPKEGRRANRAKTIRLLRNLLWKHESDIRIKPSQREVPLYFLLETNSKFSY